MIRDLLETDRYDLIEMRCENKNREELLEVIRILLEDVDVMKQDHLQELISYSDDINDVEKELEIANDDYITLLAKYQKKED